MKRKAALRQSALASTKEPTQSTSKRVRRHEVTSSEEDEEEQSASEEEDDLSPDTESDTDESDKGLIVKSPSDSNVLDARSLSSTVATANDSRLAADANISPPSVRLDRTMLSTTPMMPLSYVGVPSSQFVLPTFQMNCYRPLAMPINQWQSAQMAINPVWPVSAMPSLMMPQRQHPSQLLQPSQHHPSNFFPTTLFSTMSTPARQPFNT